MSYKIIVDSCGELPERLKADDHFENIALTIEVDGHHIIDDETFDQADFLQRVAKSPDCPKSSCPAPESYVKAFQGGAKNVYVVTLSEQLSGSYNSARLGRRLYNEEHGDKNIYVFNSRSASIGQTLIALKIEEYEKAGVPFDELVPKVEAYIEGMDTYFVLESLEALRKNGRLTGIKALVVSALNIKPIMGATKEGTIYQLDQARGIKKALDKMVQYIADRTVDGENKILAISHCNCRERAEQVKQAIEAKMKVKDIFIIDTAGISSLYASDGGIIVSV